MLIKRQLWITTIIFIIFFFVILSICIRYYYVTAIYLGPPSNANDSIAQKITQLNDAGVLVMPRLVSNDDIQTITKYINNNDIQKAKQYIMHSNIIKSQITQILGADYEFHDYIFLIKKSQFHTCHRDYNGDFFNEGQQFPSYTIIIYLENMQKCLDVIPTSHKSKNEYDYNLTDYTQTVMCGAGDAILFNANLIHNGSLNENENKNSMRVQMKISHKNDRDVLRFYNNYHKMLNVENNTPHVFKQIQKHLSCQFPVVSSYLKQYDNNKNNNNTDSGIFSNLFAKLDNV